MIRVLLGLLLVPAVCTGQPAAADSSAATAHLVRAAGMPLNDGTLAPGMLTVRLVEGAFTRDLSGQIVEVEVIGGRIESATTGSDGRAQFAHLPVGGRVRASAAIAGERLESEIFEIPAQSGVRVLLVAGTDAASPLPTSAFTSAGTATLAAPVIPAPVPVPAAPPTDAQSVAVIRAVLATATISALAFVLFSRSARK